MTTNNGRKGGRKANQWTLVAFSDISEYLGKSGVSQTAFAKAVGVTSSTFHNWKTSRCAPDETAQSRISEIITGQEVLVTKQKTESKKTTSRGSRGEGSTMLAALSGDTPKSEKKTRVSAKADDVEKPKKRVGGLVRKPRATASTNGNGKLNGGLEGWNELKALARFLRANRRRSADDVKRIVEQINAAREIAEIFA